MAKLNEPKWETWAEGGVARARLTVPTPGGQQVYEAAMQPGEIAQVRAAVLALAQSRNAALRGEDSDDVIAPAFARENSQSSVKKFEGGPVEIHARTSRPRVRVSVGPAVLEPAMPAYDASRQGLQLKLAIAAERHAALPGRPWWRRAIGLRGEDAAYGGAYGPRPPAEHDHCVELPDGTIKKTRIFHCPRGAAAAASGGCVGDERPWTPRDVDAVVGAQIREALRGRALSLVPEKLRRRAAALALRARGYRDAVVGTTGFKAPDDAFIDEALRAEQELRATKAGPHAVDDFQHDAMFGDGAMSEAAARALGGEIVMGEALSTEFLGRGATAYVGVEAIEEGVVSNLRPYARGEILDPHEVMTPPEDRFEAETLLEQGQGSPQSTTIEPSIKEPGDAIDGERESLGRREEREMMEEGGDAVGSIFTKAARGIGRTARGVGRGVGQGIRNVGRGVAAAGKVAAAAGKAVGRGLLAAITAPQKALVRAFTNKLVRRRAAKIAWDARRTTKYTRAEWNQARAWAKSYALQHGKRPFNKYIAAMMGSADEEQVAIATRQFVPARDEGKRAAVGRLLGHVAGRLAGYAAWRAGRVRPTHAERMDAVIAARGMLARRGLPVTPLGWSAAGALEVERGDWELGFDLYYMNPLSWFRSKEVNALYLAQKEAERRQEAALELKPLTEETARKWAQAQQVENAVAEDVKKIMVAQTVKPQTALVGAWWRPRPWFADRMRAVLRDADRAAPRRLPPLPYGSQPVGESASRGEESEVGSLDAFVGGLLDAIKGLLTGAKKDAPADPTKGQQMMQFPPGSQVQDDGSVVGPDGTQLAPPGSAPPGAQVAPPAGGGGGGGQGDGDDGGDGGDDGGDE